MANEPRSLHPCEVVTYEGMHKEHCSNASRLYTMPNGNARWVCDEHAATFDWSRNHAAKHEARP